MKCQYIIYYVFDLETCKQILHNTVYRYIYIYRIYMWWSYFMVFRIFSILIAFMVNVYKLCLTKRKYLTGTTLKRLWTEESLTSVLTGRYWICNACLHLHINELPNRIFLGSTLIISAGVTRTSCFGSNVSFNLIIPLGVILWITHLYLKIYITP